MKQEAAPSRRRDNGECPSASPIGRDIVRDYGSIILIAGRRKPAVSKGAKQWREGKGKEEGNRDYRPDIYRTSIERFDRWQDQPRTITVTRFNYRRHRRPSSPRRRSGTGPPSWQYANYVRLRSAPDDDDNASLARSLRTHSALLLIIKIDPSRNFL